ncbi:Fanconi anemia core complex-associated protein 24 [Aplochiton taeniatus]
MENKAPVLLDVVPPYGHVIADEKWRGSVLVQNFKGSVKAIFEKELGVLDFHLHNKRCILYISESDIVTGNSYKRKLVRYRNANSTFQETVFVEKTTVTEQNFSVIQKFVVFELGLTLLPVGGQIEAAQLISQMVNMEGKENPFCRMSVSRLLDPVVMSLVQQIPGVGKIKAMALLQHFSSIHQLGNAEFHQLDSVVGQATAQNIYNFFHNPLN